MLRIKLVTTLSVIAALLLIVSNAAAQSSTATLSGSVTDENDAAIAGATVTVTNASAGIKRTVVTNNDGGFTVPLLPPSTYQVTVQQTNFSVFQANDVVLNTNDNRFLKIRLKVGNVSVTVTVEANTTRNEGAVATAVDQKFVQNMPLNGRTLQSLISLTPGVVMSGGDGQLSINGQRTNANYLTIDGVSANIGVSRNAGGSVLISGGLQTAGLPDQNAAGATPGYNALGATNSLFSIEELQEFKVQTSNASAAFGRQSGGQIGITTRSGSNEYHGSLYEYWRHERFDARDWFTNASTTFIPKQRLRQHLFGATFSGPVSLPRFGTGGPSTWRGKDKTFFFFNYEGLRLTQPQPAVVRVVPSNAMRSLPGLHPAIKTLLDAHPKPTDESAAGCPTRTIALSTAAWDALPAAQKGGAVYSPTIPGGTIVGSCYVDASSSVSRMDAYRIKIDHNFNSNHSVMARLNSAPLVTESFTYNNRTDQQGKTYTLTAGYKATLSPTAINELNFNWSMNNGATFRSLTDRDGAVPISAAPFLPTNAPANSYVSISLPGTLGTSFQIGPVLDNQQSQWNIIDNFRLIKGSHTFGFGMDFRQLLPSYSQRDYQPSYLFSLAQTTPTVRTILDQMTAPNPILSRMLTSVFESVKVKNSNYSAYVQDTWQANKRLTLELGVRWEVNTPPVGRDKPLYTLRGFPDLTILTLSTDPFFETRYSSFGPRLGAAYQLNKRAGGETVLRGGYGTYYDLGQGSLAAAALQFPYTRSLLVPLDFIPFPVSQANLAPPAPLSLTGPYTSQSFTLTGPDYSVPRTHQWNFTVEQSLGARNLISAAYVGNAGRKLQRRYFYGFAATNPPSAGNVLPGNSNFINARLNVLRNDGEFADYSDYHSLQLSYIRRLSKGLQVLTNYTLSKAEDSGSSDVNGSVGVSTASLPHLGQSNSVKNGDAYGYSDNDRRHVFNLAVTYELPNWKSDSAGLRLLNQILVKGWGTDFNFKYQSAAPISMYYSYRDTISGITFPYRLDVVQNQPIWLTEAAASSGRRINPDAFAIPSGVGAALNSARHGNQVRNSIRGYDLYQLDLSVRRTFSLGEKLKLQFRGEMFNVTNHPSFAPPVNNFGFVASGTGVFTPVTTFGRTFSTLARSASAGTVTGGLSSIYSIGGPRSAQFSMKLLF